ncbi:MAG: hypothetical protein IT161_08820 [Bryobacterales bacterium]|nr:hypothetical protein [Bryobacterales bacterium]
MNIKDVIADEFRQLPRRLGGLRGVLILVAMIALGALPVYRFGLSFLDPLVLLAYCCFAVLFSSAFVVRSFMEGTQTPYVSDRDWILGKVLAATLYGWLAFVLILGVALMALRRAPAPSTLLPVALVAFCLAFAISGLGAVAALSSYTPASARQLLRLGIFFVLLLLAGGSQFAPQSWRDFGASLLAGRTFVRTMLLLSAFGLLTGAAAVRKAMAILASRRAGLSIL